MGKLTSKEKKELIDQRLASGDQRSYNEIAADLEVDGYNFGRGESKPIADNSKEGNRQRTIKLLEAQLVSGTKPNKFGTTKEKEENPRIPLTEKDRSRIKIELNKNKELVSNS